MITVTNAEKIKHLFMTKTLKKLRIEGNNVNIMKATMKNPQQTSYSVKYKKPKATSALITSI